jgi:hypothetical protein
MEYFVLLKNPFLKLDTVARLARQPGPVWGGGLPFAGNAWFTAPIALAKPLLSQPAGVAPLAMLRPAAYENAEYALYLLSGRGGVDMDYYRLDAQTLVYDARINWAYWEPAVQGGSLDVTAEQLKAICPPANMADLNRHVNHLNDAQVRDYYPLAAGALPIAASPRERPLC